MFRSYNSCNLPTKQKLVKEIDITVRLRKGIQKDCVYQIGHK